MNSSRNFEKFQKTRRQDYQEVVDSRREKQGVRRASPKRVMSTDGWEDYVNEGR